VVKALQSADPRVIQAIAATGMDPAQLIAHAFGGLAERAERIGQLNVSPELLQSLMGRAPTDSALLPERTGKSKEPAHGRR